MIKEIHVPDLGSAAQSEVIDIAVKPGDTIAVDDTLITLESEKASMDIPAPYAGKVKEIKTKVGDKLSTGSLILLLETAEEEKSVDTPSTSAKASADKGGREQELPTEKIPETVGARHASPISEFIHASPGVRRLAREQDIDITQIKGSGPKDRILKTDLQDMTVGARHVGVEASAKAAVSSPMSVVSAGLTETQPLTRIQKLTGQNLSRNWISAPHVTQFEEADITELEAFRKTSSQQGTAKLTILAFLMKAVVASLKAFPRFNASLDSKAENLLLKKYFNIGIAIDTPNGLVVPVIRDVDKKGLLTLAQELTTISEKARSPKGLSGADMQGSCFTISSLGGIGGTAFTPIINLPDVAILGVSKAAIKPIYSDNQFIPRLMLPLSLSYDHRVIDGAEGARFIVHLARNLTDIRQLLL